MIPWQAHANHLRNFMLKNLVWQNVYVFWSFKACFQVWMPGITKDELLFLFVILSCALAHLVLAESIKEKSVNTLIFY